MMEWNGDSTEIGEWNWVHPAVEWGMGTVLKHGMESGSPWSGVEWNGDSTETWNGIRFTLEWSGMGNGDSTETWNGIRFTLEWSGMEWGQY